MMKNGVLTFLCAFVPGAGQMYQGYMKRGLSLLLLLFAAFFAGNLFNVFMVLMLVVWMYSFFDTFNLRAQIAAGTAPADDYLVHFDAKDRQMVRFLTSSHKLVGWGLIAVGVIIFYNNIVMNTIGDLVWRWGQSSAFFRALYLVLENLPDVVFCVALILCGVWLVRGPKHAKRPLEPQQDAAPADESPEGADFLAYGATLPPAQDADTAPGEEEEGHE